MSMRYEPRGRRARALLYRNAARECDAAGYHLFAELNYEMAEWLDPTPREKPAPRKRERRPTQPPRGPDPARVGGRRDAPPRRAPVPPRPIAPRASVPSGVRA